MLQQAFIGMQSGKNAPTDMKSCFDQQTFFEAFQRLDTDNSGYLEPNELEPLIEPLLKQMWSELGNFMPRDQMIEYFAQ